MRDSRLHAKRGACALFLCAAAAAPATASAQDGGGGTMYVATPKVTKVTCLRSCASKKRLRGGSVLVVTGTELAGVNQLTFTGSYGKADDVTVRVRAGSNTRLQARVPLGAVTGPISLTTASGGHSRPSKPVMILPPLPPEPNPELSPVPGPRVAGAPAARDRHQPHQGLRGRAPGREVLLPPLGRLRHLAQGGARERSRRHGGQDLDAAGRGAGRGSDHLLERQAGARRRQAGPVLVPADGRDRRRLDRAQLAERRRPARRVRPVRPHLPDPRPRTTSAGPRAASAPGAPATRTRARTPSPSAARASWPRAAGA